MEKPSLAEAGLMEEPVQALRARLEQLMADWPDHPILCQLLVLCDRLVGAPLHPRLGLRPLWHCNLTCLNTIDAYYGIQTAVGLLHFLPELQGREVGRRAKELTAVNGKGSPHYPLGLAEF